MGQSINIAMLSPDASTHQEKVEYLTNLVNDVYDASSGDLWIDKRDRTTVKDMQQFIQNGEIAVATYMEKIVGCVRIYKINEKIAEFGMLAVHPESQGQGVGRKLIRFAEEKCRAEHFQTMQLKLFLPIHGTHPQKEILNDWYTRLGYQPVGVEAIDPQPKNLAIPCQFIIFQKALTSYSEHVAYSV